MSDLLLIISAIIAIFLIIIIVYLLRRPKSRKDATIDYTAALNCLLNGEIDKAFNKLREAVSRDTENIDAYVKIGDILREKGYIDKAIKIHRGLTVRNGLNSLERIQIYKSIVKDYRTAKKYDKAIAYCQELSDLTNNELWVQELLLRLLEEKGDWEKAFDVKKKLLRRQGEKNDKHLALYKVEAGLKLTAEGKEHDGRVKLREAIKIDKTCAPAYLYLGDSYIRENRLSDALTELKRFIEKIPDLSFLAFDRIKEILYEKGNFGEIEHIYNQLLLSNPNINSIRFALADIYDRKGELNKAIQLCQEELEKNPDSKFARQYLIQYYSKIGDKETALDLALELINDSLSEDKKFSCSHCGITENKPYWRCPNCGEWNSFLN